MNVVLSISKGGPGSGFHGHAGRPGEVGGSTSENPLAPILHEPIPLSASKIVDGRIQVDLDRFRKLYDSSNVEHGSILDENGSKWVGDFHGYDRGLNVPFTPMEAMQYNNGFFIHSHPKEGGGWGLSIEDIAMAAKFKLKTIVAIGENLAGKKVKYTLVRGNGKSWFGGRSWQDAGDILTPIAMELFDEANRLNRTIGNYSANAYIASHLVAEFAEAYGHTYSEEILD